MKYSISEAYVPGYAGQVSGPIYGTVSGMTWEEATTFVNGKEYILKTDQGCLSARSASSDKLCFVEESVAKDSPLALWTATVSNGMVRLTNQEGQSLNFDRNNGWSFKAVKSGSEMNLTPYSEGGGLILTITKQHPHWTEIIYMSNQLNNDYLSGNGSHLVFHPLVRSETSAVPDGSIGFTVTNTPLDQETSLKVKKEWQDADEELYEQAQVTFKLFANGQDTGRTETVSLKTEWTAIFQGLPYVDAKGNRINYTVVEVLTNNDWIAVYGDVQTKNPTRNPTYETVVTNKYRWVNAVELPSTGGIGLPLYILCGLMLVSAPFVYGLSLRRRYRKGAKE